MLDRPKRASPAIRESKMGINNWVENHQLFVSHANP